MKYENVIAMNLQHLDDAIETTGGQYNDIVNVLFGTILHAMVRAHQQDLTEVIEDIRRVADHYIVRCETIMADNVSKDRVLH
jgi:hypothetical protein